MNEGKPLQGSRAQAATRWLTLVASALLLGLGLSSMLESVPIPPGFNRASYVMKTAGAFEKRERKHPPVAFLGDSLTFANRRDFPVPGWLRLQLRETNGGEGTGVFNMSQPGFTQYTHYFLSEDITELAPARVILSVNLHWWARNPRGHLPDFAAMLPPRRWPEALQLPLHAGAVTAADLIFGHLVLATGAQELRVALGALQFRFQSVVDNFAASVDAWSGRPGFEALRTRLIAAAVVRDGLRRGSAEWSAHRFSKLFRGLAPDDPGITVIAASAAHYTRRGIPTLVVVQPINVEHLRTIEVFDAAGIESSLAALRDATLATGADFLDLHDILEDEAFADSKGHLKYDARGLPARRVALEILPWLQADAPATEDAPGVRKARRPPP